ncbi:hypothetical protein [Spongiivirga citrea]|uniref:hypothetical protein n=1 Tax=Spongiivirga citrea TaxID=1481457 RepID=UPI0019535761|nr:hypothetical protein [Spongiivirga citrea]
MASHAWEIIKINYDLAGYKIPEWLGHSFSLIRIFFINSFNTPTQGVVFIVRGGSKYKKNVNQINEGKKKIAVSC